MADDNIQTLQYVLSTGNGALRGFQTEVNKKTGASVTYETTRPFQKDPILRNDPVTNPDGTQSFKSRFIGNALTATPAEKIFLQKVNAQSDNQRAAFINKNYTPQQKDTIFKGVPKVTSVPDPANPSNGATPTTISVADVNSFNVESKIAAPGNFENLVYPLASKTSKSFDYIKFTTMIYGTRTIAENALTFGERQLKEAGGSVSLPIQSGITDSNGVGWNDQSVNSAQLLGAGISVQAQNGTPNLVERVTSELQKTLADKKVSSSIKSMLQLYFAGQAVNANIATKITGAIANPNLELLFNGPQLRPFTFNFKLSPRSQNEATEIKKILRFFKQNMAVRRGVKDLFLKSPNVFNIEYFYKKTTQHGGLNLIKTCALQNFSVDYTPEGSYATFYEDSGDGSMVSYNISLTFMEIEPIYADDYAKYNKSVIGY
jgi:hypothetical protein